MKRLVKKSLICASSLFVVNFVLMMLSAQSMFLVTAAVLPGFMYGYALCDFTVNRFKFKKGVFIVVAGALHLLSSLVAYQPMIGKSVALIPTASTVGALLLYVLYYNFVNRNLKLAKGLGLAALIGFLSSFPMLTAFLYIKQDQQTNVLGILLILSIFMLWQPLFGWVIEFTKTENVTEKVISSGK